MIVGVAIKKDHIVFCLPKPFRHGHVIKMMKYSYNEGRPLIHQGFITDDWKYLNREDALVHAIISRQCLEENILNPPELFSEDLW